MQPEVKEMRTVDDYEAIRRAYFLDGLSIREIARNLHHSRRLIRKALAQAEPDQYKLTRPRPAPVLAPYKPKIEELLEESDRLPRKQRYTGHKIYLLLKQAGYSGSEGSVHNYICQRRKIRKKRQAYLPLEFDPGQDGQVDWAEAVVEMAGKRIKVELFILRLNYSKARFVMAFPFQKQEAFFEGHIQAFHFFGGVPKRIAYDNLKTAVYRILEGHNRKEQEAFKAFRSHYLFESYYCNVGQGHEKGGVESDVGYVQRNFCSPIPQVADFAELNAHLRQACLDDLHRKVRGQQAPVMDLWQAEKPLLLPLHGPDYRACSTHVAKVNPYSQVVFETNRYSVPTAFVSRQLVLRAYSFRIEILSLEEIVATHPRCFERERDILDPLHYLSLLAQRPGAFEHALPLRQWRKTWPADYERLLAELLERLPGGEGVREFIAILKLHQVYPAGQVAQAIRRALELGAAHLDGVQMCLRESQMERAPSSLQAWLPRPELAEIGCQPVDLEQYNQLLGGR
jgi:transposase